MRLGEGAIVSRYARALFEAAVERDAVTAVRRDMQGLRELLLANRELKILLENPGLSRAKVRYILVAVADKLQLDDMSRRFVNLLLEKDRIEILPEIEPVFERLVFEREGKIAVTVTTAVPVAEPVQERIVTHLKQKSGKDPIVAWRQNSQLLGGLVIEWPDHVFDGSLARKLLNMKAQLAGSM